MKSQILSLLRDGGDYVSGQEICEHFGVSRTAVWKVVKQLREEGYRIEAVQNKGYRLIDSVDVLNGNELKSRMETKWAGQTVYYFDKTGSTNIDAKKFAADGAPHGTIVVADDQENGRGRRGRTWQSPAGSNVYFTIVLRPAFEPDKASMLTLVMAMSVAEAIGDYCGIRAQIKWPNDIVINKKKVCGILTEMEIALETNDIQYVVIGVGINTNQEEFPEEMKEIASSLVNEGGRKVSRAGMIQKVMESFERNYESFARIKDLSQMREAYDAMLVNKDRQVKVLDPKGEYTGIAKGINEKGELLVQKKDGQIEAVYAGEVSVRGLYSYV
ncbi:MAG: biotin--[acetyl-CoA-carboxylase] ligase [Lachnospiraceae bacterium]|nr:biotin--[acetyl-CoA-carboxylase] ligase [Lachnospiraceae bacterium]